MNYERYRADQFGLSHEGEYLHALDLHLGGRYFPKFPTFGVGGAKSGLAFRLTFSATGGASLLIPQNTDLSSVWAISAELTAGLAITTGDSPSGIMVECVYRPLSNTLNFKTSEGSPFASLVMKPVLALRLTLVFGP